MGRAKTGLPGDRRETDQAVSHSGFAGDSPGRNFRPVKRVVVPPIRRTVAIPPLFNFRSASVQVSTESRLITAASKTRRYLLIQNTGAVTVWLGFGVAASTSGQNSIKLPAGSQVDFSNGIAPNGDINAVCSSSCSLSILEGH